MEASYIVGAVAKITRPFLNLKATVPRDSLVPMQEVLYAAPVSHGAKFFANMTCGRGLAGAALRRYNIKGELPPPLSLFINIGTHRGRTSVKLFLGAHIKI